MERRVVESGESRYERRSRGSLRLPLQCRAQYIFNDVGRVATTRDLGADGIFVPTAKPLPHGTLVELALTLDQRLPTVQVAARVVRTVAEGEQPGMALAFTGRRLEEARGEVAAFLLGWMEREQRPAAPGESHGEARLARRQLLVQNRERELDNRARTLDRVLAAVDAERARQADAEAELERRRAAVTHREACLDRLAAALAEKEAVLAHGAPPVGGDGGDEATRPDV